MTLLPGPPDSHRLGGTFFTVMYGIVALILPPWIFPDICTMHAMTPRFWPLLGILKYYVACSGGVFAITHPELPYHLNDSSLDECPSWWTLKHAKHRYYGI